MSQPTATIPPHQHQQPQGQEQGCSPSVQCTPRWTFWIAAGASWVVWAFAVGAAADDKWIDDTSQGEWVAVAQDGILAFCNDLEDWQDDDFDTVCTIYRAFSAMQIIATIACSISVLLLALACFLPAVGGCASVRTFAFVGGVLMATYALFQLLAVVLAGVLKQELNGVSDEPEIDGDSFYGGSYISGVNYEADVGPTFGVGVSGLIFAVIAATLLLLFARRAGGGPLHDCCRSLMLANKNNGPIFGGGGGGGGVAGETKPVAVFGVPLPEPQATAATAGDEEAGVPPPPRAAAGTAAETADEQQIPPPRYDVLPAAAGTAAAAAAAAAGEQQVPPPRYDSLPPAEG